MEPIDRVENKMHTASDEVVAAAQALGVMEQEADTLLDWVHRLQEPVIAMHQMCTREQMKTKVFQLGLQNMDLQKQVMGLVKELSEARTEAMRAQERIYDVLLDDDGQAYKEARKYLEKSNPGFHDLLQRAGK